MEINMKLITFVLSVISNRKDVQTPSSSLPINVYLNLCSDVN